MASPIHRWSAVALTIATALLSAVACDRTDDKPQPALLLGGAKATAPFANSLDMMIVSIPGGTYQMGERMSAEEVAKRYQEKAEWTQDEHPQHTVTVRAFRLSACEVTVGQFRQFVEATHYVTDAEKGGQKRERGKKGGYVIQRGSIPRWDEGASWRKPGFPQTNDHPVVLVSWNDAVAFCKWLSSRPDEREKWRNYRLPTEAEWEYACRAGTDTAFWWGDDFDDTGRVANIADRRAGKKYMLDFSLGVDDGFAETAPVGSYPANRFGIADMVGNVSEWCADWNDLYTAEAQQNPIGPDSGQARVLRGASWWDAPGCSRSAERGGYEPDMRCDGVGFRVALDAP